jgi:hypothetical protein
LIFCPWNNHLSAPNNVADSEAFVSFVGSLEISNLELVRYSTVDPEEATKIWKERIIAAGGVFKPARNPREITYLNIKKYFDAPHITWAGADDHKKAKVEIEKEKSFKDHQELRKRRAEW